MKTFLLLITTFILCISTYSFAQMNNYYFVPRGTHFSGGLFSAAPTNNIIFPDWRKQEQGLVKQTMLSEWYSPKLGGFLEVAYNFNEDKPFFIGGSMRWQAIFKDGYKETRVIDNPNYASPDVEWKLKKTVRYFNFNIFTEYTYLSYRNFNFFARADIGLGQYRMKNKFDWEIDAYDTTHCGPRTKENDFVFSGDLSLGVRWQFSHSSSLTFSAGYQLQTANDFRRREYMSSVQGHLNEDNLYPKDDDFWTTSDYYEGRPERVQNEFLYFKLGLTHQITSAGFKDFMAEKPVLYLYPQDTTEVRVNVELNNHEMIFDYPKYNDGWTVKATPQGDLFDKMNRQYYCLFWETQGPAIAENLTEGFLIHKSEAVDFLEDKLAELGLNAKESNEFIIYWLPKLQQSEYSAVYFAQEEYEEVAKLKISPKPDQVIRVMMLFEGLDEPIKLTEQELPETPDRFGFTAVEWGGSEGEFFEKPTLFCGN
ncbi:MAG: hypothetical protein WED10_03180 [Brumimicrobium sp.]